jgi:hypothetical protein
LLLSDAIAAAHAVPLAPRDRHDRAGALAAIADELPDEQAVSLLKEALAAAEESIDDSDALAVARAGLAQFASTDRAQRERAIAIARIRQSDNNYDICSVAVALPEAERSVELNRLLDKEAYSRK